MAAGPGPQNKQTNQSVCQLKHPLITHLQTISRIGNIHDKSDQILLILKGNASQQFKPLKLLPVPIDGPGLISVAGFIITY